MTTKQKILKAIDCALEDISEERLIDILLDAFNAKKKRITELEGANAREKVLLQTQQDQLRDDARRMRSDPLWGPSGEYYFAVNDHKFVVQVSSGHIRMFERQAQVDYAACQLTPTEFNAKWP